MLLSKIKYAINSDKSIRSADKDVARIFVGGGVEAQLSIFIDFN